MKRSLIVAVLTTAGAVVSALGGIYAWAACGDTWQVHSPDTYDIDCDYGVAKNFSQTKHWRIFWVDGYERNDAHVTSRGQCYGGIFSNSYCNPVFLPPYWHQNTSGLGEWNQKTIAVYMDGDLKCNASTTENNYHRHSCSTAGSGCTQEGWAGGCVPGTVPDGLGGCCAATDSESCATSGWYWNFTEGYCQDSPWYCGSAPQNCGLSFMWSTESCRCEYVTPVLVDVSGDGFRMTDAAGGVRFDLNADGAADRLSWTAAGSDDAWLALDRDGNGVVDNGRELFGTFTPQPAPPAGEERNGFLALAAYDKVARGGNGDGLIDARDAAFASLRLWRDSNHDGLSQPSELDTLPALGLSSIETDYKESKRTDEHGNQFRYRARVRDAQGAQLGRWAWDVFLVRLP